MPRWSSSRAWCAVLAWVLCAGLALAEAPVLSAPQARALIAAGEIVVLDIRAPEEWAETGVAEGALPVSMHRPGFAEALGAILAQNDPGQVALICATGGRSAHVAEVLERNGITGVQDISEGMLGNPRGPGWVARGLPVVGAEAALAARESVLGADAPPAD